MWVPPYSEIVIFFLTEYSLTGRRFSVRKYYSHTFAMQSFLPWPPLFFSFSSKFSGCFILFFLSQTWSRMLPNQKQMQRSVRQNCRWSWNKKERKKKKAVSYRGSCKVDKELLFVVWWNSRVSQWAEQAGWYIQRGRVSGWCRCQWLPVSDCTISLLPWSIMRAQPVKNHSLSKVLSPATYH